MTINSSDLIEAFTKLSKSKNRAKDLVVYVTNYGMKEHKFLFNGIKENISHYIAFIEVAELADLKTILNEMEALEEAARPKYIFFDSNICRNLIHLDELKLISRSSKCFVYFEVKAWSDSIVNLVADYYQRKEFKTILLAGKSEISKRIFKDILDLGLETYYYAPDQATKDMLVSLVELYDAKKLKVIETKDLAKYSFDCIVSSELKANVFDKSHAQYFSKSCLAIDAGINNFSAEFIEKQFALGSEIIRIDNRAALSSYLISILETEDLIDNGIGKLTYQGVNIVAGGYMGLENEIIVDNISKPSLIIGVANGAGKVKYPPYDKELQAKVDIVKQLLNKSKA